MIYLIIGAEEREIEFINIIKKIRENNPNIREQYFDMAENEEEKVYSELNFVSIFGEKTLLVLKRCEKIKKIEKFLEEIRKFDLSKKEIVIDYEDEKLETLKKIKDNDNIEIISVKKQNNHEKLIELCRKELNLDEEEALELINIIGTNVNKLKNEIDKIKNYLNGDVYSLDKIKDILSPDEEYNIFEMTEYLLKNKKQELIKNLKKDSNYMLFLANLNKDLRTYLKLRLLYNENKLEITSNYKFFNDKIYPNIKKYFLDHPYVIFKKISRVSDFTKFFLIKKIEECIETERKIKTGEMPERLAVELLILKF